MASLINSTKYFVGKLTVLHNQFFTNFQTNGRGENASQLVSWNPDAEARQTALCAPTLAECARAGTTQRRVVGPCAGAVHRP